MTTDSIIINGAEPIFHEGGAAGVLICHGFNGTPQSMAYIGDMLRAAGFTVSIPLLSGHGTSPEALEAADHKDWIRDLSKAYDDLCQRCRFTFLLGQSMGGALSLIIAASQKTPDGLITINAALDVPCYHSLPAQRFLKEGRPDIKDPSAYEITYPSIPAKSVEELFTTMEHAKTILPDVTCPVILFKSLEDHVVPPSCSDEVYQTVSSSYKELKELHNSYHVASLDYDKHRISEQSITFIQAQLNQNKNAGIV